MGLLEELSKEGCKLAIVLKKLDKALKVLNQVYFGEYIKVAMGEDSSGELLKIINC
jgi:phosphoglycolate phosphatase